jgi:hypothetical protein
MITPSYSDFWPNTQSYITATTFVTNVVSQIHFPKQLIAINAPARIFSFVHASCEGDLRKATFDLFALTALSLPYGGFVAGAIDMVAEWIAFKKFRIQNSEENLKDALEEGETKDNETQPQQLQIVVRDNEKDTDTNIGRCWPNTRSYLTLITLGTSAFSVMYCQENMAINFSVRMCSIVHATCEGNLPKATCDILALGVLALPYGGDAAAVMIDYVAEWLNCHDATDKAKLMAAVSQLKKGNLLPKPHKIRLPKPSKVITMTREEALELYMLTEEQAKDPDRILDVYSRCTRELKSKKLKMSECKILGKVMQRSIQESIDEFELAKNILMKDLAKDLAI